MRNQLKNTTKHTAIYSIGGISSKLIGFVLLPLYTKELALAEYGMLGIIETTIMILVGVFSFKIPTAMQRWCAEAKDELTERKVVFIAFATLSIIAMGFSALTHPFSTAISKLLLFDVEHFSLIHLMLLSVAFEVMNFLPMELLRYKERSVTYITLTSVKLLAIVSLNIYFIAVLNLGVFGVLLGQVIGNGLLFLLALPFMLKNMSLGYDKSIAMEMFRYGSPLIFTTISTLLLSLSDRYILNYYHSFDDLGLYTLGYKIASVVNVFILQSFTMGYLPIAYKTYNQPNFNSFYRKTLTYLSLAMCFCIVGLSAYSKEAVDFVAKNDSYLYASFLVPIIATVFFFKGLQYVFTLTFHFIKKTYLNIKIVMFGVVMNIVLNFLLVPDYSYMGAIAATNITYIAMVVYVYFESRKYLKIEFEIGKIFKLMTVLAVSILAIYYSNLHYTWLSVVYKTLVVIAFPVILYLWKFYDQKEIEQFMLIVRNKLNKT